MIGERLLRIGSLLCKSAMRNNVAVARARIADTASTKELHDWVIEEAEKRQATLSPQDVRRIIAIATRRIPCRPPSGQLAIVLVYFNPAQWSNLKRNYLRTCHTMAWHNVPIFRAEACYPGDIFPTDDAFIRVEASSDNVLWQKERLINLVVERLPSDITHVAWIDADVFLLHNDWPQLAMHALRTYPVVQLWSRWHCAGRDGEVAEVLRSAGAMGDSYLKGGSPGGAWAAKRSVFPLYDKHIVGSGDAMALEGWMGMKESYCMSRMTPALKREYGEWATEAYRKVGGRIGNLKLDAVHLYHGTRSDRQYVNRWNPLIAHGYDPGKHVKVDDKGLLAWTSRAPDSLKTFVAHYFDARNEDL